MWMVVDSKTLCIGPINVMEVVELGQFIRNSVDLLWWLISLEILLL